MKRDALATVQEMFAAFGSGDLERFGQTVSVDTLWIYHGTQEIPKATFEGRESAVAFIRKVLTRTEVISFDPQQFICEDKMVVVIGQEHQRVIPIGHLKYRCFNLEEPDSNWF